MVTNYVLSLLKLSFDLEVDEHFVQERMKPQEEKNEEERTKVSCFPLAFVASALGAIIQCDQKGPEFQTWSGSGPKCQKWSGIGPDLVLACPCYD